MAYSTPAASATATVAAGTSGMLTTTGSDAFCYMTPSAASTNIYFTQDGHYTVIYNARGLTISNVPNFSTVTGITSGPYLWNNQIEDEQYLNSAITAIAIYTCTVSGSSPSDPLTLFISGCPGLSAGNVTVVIYPTPQPI
jgi:hypothetical protein